MKRTALTCKEPGKFFHDCFDCKHYDDCDYFDKPKRKKKRKNLTTAQIHDSTTTMELIFRMNCLYQECKRRPEDAGIPMTDIWEAIAIIKELRRRLGRLGIFYLEVKNEK